MKDDIRGDRTKETELVRKIGGISFREMRMIITMEEYKGGECIAREDNISLNVSRVSSTAKEITTIEEVNTMVDIKAIIGIEWVLRG